MEFRFFHPSILLSLIATLAAGSAVIFIRLRASSRPATIRKIIIPPLGMATGFLMFVVPETRVPLAWAAAAFAAGALFFAYPLIRTTTLEQRGSDIYVRRSKTFIWIIVGLLALRLALHAWVEEYVSLMQTGGLFFVLAFGMILPWRLAMLRQYRRLTGSRSGEE